MSVANLSLGTVSANCPSLFKELEKSQDGIFNLLMTGYTGLNAGISAGCDWYFHDWFALTGELGYLQHALLYHPFTTEKLFTHQYQISFGLKTIF